ncbi:UPF0747 protein Plut_0360 [Waddlia chondrophila 2032/99]|uniref:Cysteine ligase BshC n=2 Tax=Waddlia chondrophila TaxID=71667 RepID=D6YVC9_WADCW|nr:bacillithiol biosynthesis cysteine-adding enzyme BshC [Waddlia chondrophila]ADI38090.1 conserved hypothetical protein [Waddlia chondrophila WSU 86-1044]CCB91209.1 UPF0747 protein Plut_0360 [Waddlia chondrophila 2032/99]
MQLIEKKEPCLYREDSLSAFYSIAPYDSKGAEKAGALVQGRTFQRDTLADILETYNRGLGNGAAALENIARFRKPSTMCVFSGQQLGLFGGPAYTVLKALTCLLLARQHGAVPMFWMATEDHDVDEIDHTYLIDNLGNLNKFHLSLPKDGRFVENLTLSGEHQNELKRFCQVIGREDLYQIVRGETSYCLAMAKVMAEIFKGTGLIFLEPRILRPFAVEFLKREISDCDQIAHSLSQSAQKLSLAGGTAVLDVSQGTNLFIKMRGSLRCKIYRMGKDFEVRGETYSEKQLLQLIEKEPERFSTNAAARCVLQSWLFPVLAYAAGPSELMYYRQLKDYHEYHGISMPWIVPRLSLSVVTPIAQEMLEKIGRDPWDKLPESWIEIVPSIEEGGEGLTHEWIASAENHFGRDLSEESIRRFAAFQSEKLKRKAILSRLRKKGIAPHSLHYLKNLLHPHDNIQERVLNWWEFQSHVDYSVIDELLKQLNTVPRGHLYCFL